MIKRWSCVPDDPEEFMELRKACLFAYIGGITSPKALCRYLHLPETEENWKAIRYVIQAADFLVDAKRGREDQIASVLDRIRDNVHLYVSEMEAIALTGEERNRVAMLKDLMDRAGTGAALKLATTTASEYKRIAQDLLKEDTDAVRE